MAEINLLVDFFEIISNPRDLKIEIENGECVIFKASDGKKLCDVVLESNTNNDYPAQVGNFLKSIIKEFDNLREDNPNLKLISSQTGNLEDMEIMTISQADIIAAGLREHDGEFKTYK